MKIIPELNISEDRQKYLNEVYDKWIEKRVKEYIRDQLKEKKTFFCPGCSAKFPTWTKLKKHTVHCDQFQLEVARKTRMPY